jgi:hypothetical protein
MFWRLVLIGIALTFAQGAELTGPSEFHVVSVFFSDHGPLFYYRVTEVKQDGQDTLIRYARVGWTNSELSSNDCSSGGSNGAEHVSGQAGQ